MVLDQKGRDDHACFHNFQRNQIVNQMKIHSNGLGSLAASLIWQQNDHAFSVFCFRFFKLNEELHFPLVWFGNRQAEMTMLVFSFLFSGLKFKIEWGNKLNSTCHKGNSWDDHVWVLFSLSLTIQIGHFWFGRKAYMKVALLLSLNAKQNTRPATCHKVRMTMSECCFLSL